MMINCSIHTSIVRLKMGPKTTVTWILLSLVCFNLANCRREISALYSSIEKGRSNSQPRSFDKSKLLGEVLQDLSITEGCQLFPSLCKNKEEIQTLMQETTAKLKELNEEREASLSKVNLLKNINAKTGHLLHTLNKTEQTLLQVINNSRSIDLEQEKHLMLYNRNQTQRFSEKNFGFNVDRIVEPLEYRLSGVKRFLAGRKTKSIELLAVQYIIDTSMKYLIYAITQFFSAYEETRIQMDELSLEEYLFKFFGKNMSMTSDEIEILKHPEKPQYTEIAENYGLLTTKYHLTWNMVQSIIKEGWVSGEPHIKNKLSVPELADIWKSQSFESKLGVSMESPLIDVKESYRTINFILRRSSKSFEFTFRKSDGNALFQNAISITTEAVINAIKNRSWNAAGENMEELKIQYKNYIRNVTHEVQGVKSESQKFVVLMQECQQQFKDTAYSFFHFVSNETNNDLVVSVLELETFTRSKHFDRFYKNITNENELAFYQEHLFRIINLTKHGLDRLEAWTRSQLIIFSYVGIATKNNEPIIRMHNTLQDIFAFQSVQIKRFGNSEIDIAELLCIISLIRRDRDDYDGYSLKSIRGNCFTHSAVSFTSKALDQYKKAIIQKTVMTEVQKRHFEDPRAILDAVINIFITHSDSRLRSAWGSLSEKDIMCVIAIVFPRRDTYAFYNLFHFRPNCSKLSIEEFRQLKKKADTKRNWQNMKRIKIEICRMQLCTTTAPTQPNVTESPVDMYVVESANEQPSRSVGTRNYSNIVATIILVFYYLLYSR